MLTFDKKPKLCVKRINLVTDDDSNERKSFLYSKKIFIHTLWIMANISILTPYRSVPAVICQVEKYYIKITQYFSICWCDTKIYNS